CSSSSFRVGSVISPPDNRRRCCSRRKRSGRLALCRTGGSGSPRTEAGSSSLSRSAAARNAPLRRFGRVPLPHCAPGARIRPFGSLLPTQSRRYGAEFGGAPTVLAGGALEFIGLGFVQSSLGLSTAPHRVVL